MLSRILISLVLVVPALEARADVVVLNDGRTLVGTVTHVDDALVVRTLDGRVDVDRDAVGKITRDDALQRKLTKAARKASSDWEGALRLVDEAMRAGLFDEAAALADAVHVATHRSASTPRFALPPDFDRLPVAGVAHGETYDDDGAARLLHLCGDESRPASARLASARLATGHPPVDLLLRSLDDDAPGVRAAAVTALGESRPDGGLEPLIERMLFDDAADVRAAATAAARQYDDDGVVVPLVRALQTEDAGLRDAAMDAIETLHATRAVGALVRNLRRVGGDGKTRAHFSNITHTSYVSDFDVEIAQAAVIGQPIVKVLQSGVTQEVGVAGVFATIGPSERRRIVNLLTHLTGQELGYDPDAWHQWLMQRQPGRDDEGAE